MDKLLQIAETHLVEAALEEIFHSLDIMIGRFLDIFDGLGIGVGKAAVDIAQFLGTSGHLGQLWAQVLELHAEGDEIFDLDADTVFDQCPFGKELCERLAL